MAPTSKLVTPESEWVTEDLFTYWQPYLPPGLSAASPVEGACFNGGARIAEDRTSELLEVSARDVVSVEGFNFVPSPHLSCVYHHVGGSGFAGVEDYQVFLPATFVKSSEIQCPIPTIKYADDGTHLSRTMWLTVTNDGITYRYSHTKFTYVGDCLPTKFTTVTFGIIGGLGLLLLGACLFGGRGGGGGPSKSRDVRFEQLEDEEEQNSSQGRSWTDSLKAGAASASAAVAAASAAAAQKAREAKEVSDKRSAEKATKAAADKAADKARQTQITAERVARAEKQKANQQKLAADAASAAAATATSAYRAQTAPSSIPSAGAPAAPAAAPARPLASAPKAMVNPSSVDSEARLKQPGTLTVLVKEAKNLKGRDAEGLSNPYVAIKVKNHKTWKSQVHKRTLNPKFDEKFVAKGLLGDFVNNLMLLKVLDRNNSNIVDGTKGDSLGDLSFKLDGLRTRNRVPYEDVDLDMVETGAISVILTWEADADSSLSI